MIKIDSSLPTVAIIGAGSVGIALARLFRRNGFSVTLGSRNRSRTQATIGNTEPLTQLHIAAPIDAVQHADINLLTVTDGAIETVCESLSRYFKSGSIVMHCAGALDSSILRSAHQISNCATCSSHPLNTFPNIQAAVELLADNQHGTYLYCEGNEQALKYIQPHFNRVGFNSVKIATAAKPRYHMACVFACNYLTTLMETSLQTAATAKLERDTFWKAIQPLIQATLANISEHGTSAALSGPIARADKATIEKHLSELKSCSDGTRNLYITMALETVKLALKNDQLDQQSSAQLRQLLTSN